MKFNQQSLKCFIIFIGLLIMLGYSQLPISDCFGNCLYCQSMNPNICLSSNLIATNSPKCLPFYTGSKCELNTNAYQNFNRQNGTFQNWSYNKTQQCIVQNISNANQSINASTNKFITLGPFQPNQIVTKPFTFQGSQQISRLILKLTLAVYDPQILNLAVSTNSTQSQVSVDSVNTTQVTILPNGSKLITITTTTTTTNSTTSTKTLQNITYTGLPFLFIQFSDGNNNLLQKNLISYNQQSMVYTTCGWVYQYQIPLDLNSFATNIVIRMYLANNNAGVLWNLMNIDLNGGCSGFVASNGGSTSKCNTCISGYYPQISSINNQVQECVLCDYRCKTCINSTVCLTCSQYTTFNPASQMCEFPSSFTTFSNYSVSTGQNISPTTSYTNGGLTDVIKSKGSIVNFQNNLSTNQPYQIMFNLMYSEVFKNTTQNIIVQINGVNYTITSANLPLYTSTFYPNLSNSQRVYMQQFSYSYMNDSSNLNFSKSINTSIQAFGNTQEFAVSNYKVVQYQCTQNCMSCSYTISTQLSVCNKCSSFYDKATNCVSCANGFYVQNNIQQNTSICVKCHSTCLQCVGPDVGDCRQCFSGFQLGKTQYNYNCIKCLYSSQSQSNSSLIPECNSSPTCLIQHPLTLVLTDSNCNACLKSSTFDNVTSTPGCLQCWLSQNLASSTCDPTPQSGYQIYGTDLQNGVISNQWSSSKNLTTFSCSSNYPNLYGISATNTSTKSSLIFTQNSLPSHQGLTIVFNIFKIDSELISNNQTINILVQSGGISIDNQTIVFGNNYGNNICGGNSNQMIFTFIGNYTTHVSPDKLQVLVSCSDDGIFLRQMEMYLGNCPSCSQNNINYQAYYIPRYSTNETQTGLDVWLTFNQAIRIQPPDQNTQNKVLNSFQFTIDQLGYSKLLPYSLVQNKLSNWNYLKYFVPLNTTMWNATLRINNTMSSNIYSQKQQQHSRLLLQQKSQYNGRILLSSQLPETNIEEQIFRYQNVNPDDRRSMDQLFDFYNFFQWFTLFTMIVVAFFGIGIIFEQFSILIQLLFLHIYMSTNILPATFKQPLSALQKMQNLNFFAYPHAKGIQDGWFKNISIDSPFPFTQYNIDIYFARSFYPIIIINLIYLFWFIVLFLLLKCVKPFRNSKLKFVRFFRDIPQRPLNYFDQIWRYQFITTMWASFLQFQNFDGSTAQMRLNLALCIAAFSISLIWPIFVMFYTQHQHYVMNVQHYLYQYQDIYYKKISSTAQSQSYFFYIAIRFGRYFFYALFIAVFIYQNIIGPIILLMVTFIQIVYIFRFKIFRNNIYLTFKMIQNIGFLIVEILLLIVYGFSDNTLGYSGYTNLGFGITTLFILMIINGILRFLYLGYKKFKDFFRREYDYGQKGEMQVYDNKNPIPIPTSDRIGE